MSGFCVGARFPKWPRLAVSTAVLGFVSVLVALPAQAQQRRECLIKVSNAPPIHIDSFAGEVLINGRRLRAANFLLCPGDEIRTGPIGRVAIRFDAKRTIIRLDGNSRAKIPSDGRFVQADVSLLSGVLYFLSSVRRRFHVETPYMVAGIEGTEALVATQPARHLAIAAVRQGIVNAYSQQEGPGSRLAVNEGEAAFTSATVKFQKAPIGALPPPFRDLLIVSDSSVDWAVYYPPILFAPDARRTAVRRAVHLMHTGDYERADRVLNAAARTDPSATAALRTIIAVGRNRLDEAQRWAELALRADRKFAPAHVAASYERQANGDLEAALRFAIEAAALAPDDAYVLARLAELHMTIGDRLAALKMAQRSLAIAPTPLALFVAGLANLAAVDYARAEAQFRDAIRLDAQAPLPRLGLGLAFIRQGRVAEGAWEIERALAHDPRRAAIRTWLGRAYFDEGLIIKAADQFRLSQKDDPQDPRPYLFAALGKFSANQILHALDDVLEAEKRSAGRRVLRSEHGLREDAATRGAALGRLYDTLSFGQLAIVTGSKATDADPSDPGAHRFLADVYRSRPNYNIAQTSELLRSQLLSPPSKTPAQPQLAEARLALLDTTGPSRVAFAEFSSLFNSDGLRLDGAGLYGTQNTRSAEWAVTGLYRNASLSVGKFNYLTDGYHANNDLSHDVFNAVGKIALTPEFILFGEYRHRESEGGDRRLNFDLNNFAPDVRVREERNISRFGFHARPTPTSDLIGVYTRARLANDVSDELPLFFFTIPITASDDEDAQSGQIQYIRNDARVRSVIGGSYLRNDIAINSSFGGFPSPTTTFDTEYYNGYAYFNFELPTRVKWTLGGSAVHYRQSNSEPDVTLFHPKLGVSVGLNDYVTLRGGYLRNLKPNLVSEQTIEPTTIAGFNQFYDAFDGSTLEQAGVGIDFKTNYRFWFGGEAVKRWWDVPITGVPDGGKTIEQVHRAYFSMAVSNRIALSGEVRQEKSESNVPFDFSKWQTISAPVTLSYFSDYGVFAALRAEYVDHKFGNIANPQKDTFTTVSASLGYRLPKNKGIVSVEVHNLFDTEFNFQNRTIRPDLSAKPRYAPTRTIIARGVIKF